MKKFLIFLVSIIVALSLSMTFYYFAKDDEVIKFRTNTLYLNVGDTVSLGDLGFSHTDKKKETKINFNAGGESSSSVIKYDSITKKYVTTKTGGTATIVITTNNHRFKRFEISVVVGNGSEEAPFNICDEDDLFDIGTERFDINTAEGQNIVNAQTAHYQLLNDIDITENHFAIGKDELNYNEFLGTFNGQYHYINDLTINSDTYGGLFGIIGKNAQVTNLFLKNTKVVGEYDYAGALAGVCSGYVDRVAILNPTIDNEKYDTTTHTGGLAGLFCSPNMAEEEVVYTSTANRILIEASNDSSYIKGRYYVGGFAGEVSAVNVEGIKVSLPIISTSTVGSYCGAFAGYITFNEYGGYFRESYSLCTISLASTRGDNGSLFGYINGGDGSDIDKPTILLGLYYDTSKCSLPLYGKTTFILGNTSTLGGKSNDQLDNQNTYIFYYDNDYTPIAWKSSIWDITHGQKPILKFTTTLLTNDINRDIQVSAKPIDKPDDGGNTPSDPVIDKPVSSNVVTILTASQLSTLVFETGKTYQLGNNINMSGYNWTPRKLVNSTFTSKAGNTYTISNVNIVPKSTYCGFFSSANNSSITNVSFNNITINLPYSVDYVGGLVGVINGSLISKVKITGLNIYSNLAESTPYDKIPEYVGGIAGATTTSYGQINECSVTGNIKGNIKNAGGIVGLLDSNNSVLSSTFCGTVEAKNFLGGIVAKNQGIIRSCAVASKINSIKQNNAHAYVGGIAGANFNSISSCSSQTTITVNNWTSKYTYMVGGICGYNVNSASISNCHSINDSSSSYEACIDIFTNMSDTFIGGIVAINDGEVSHCSNNMTDISNYLNKVYAGGIVASNANSVYACSNNADVYGQYIGGIAYRNLGNGVIQQCAVGSNSKRVFLKGNSVAGIVNYMPSGKIANCLAIVTSYGIDSKSESASIVINFPVSSGTYGEISYCVVSNNFQGNGNKYMETPCHILGKTRTTGTINNCVIDDSYTSGKNVQVDERDYFLFIKRDNASGSNYTIASSSKMKTFSTYSNLDFSILTTKNAIWLFNGAIPTLTVLS